LPGPGRPRDEVALPRDRQPVDLLVEGPPVRHLDLRQPPLVLRRAPVTGGRCGLVLEPEVEEGSRRHARSPWSLLVSLVSSPPSPRPWSAWSSTPPSPSPPASLPAASPPASSLPAASSPPAIRR